MSGHTPGPWAAFDTQEDCYEITCDARLGIIPIATLEYGFEGYIEPQQHANARLIAAAPDLLEALREMVSCFDMQAEPLGYEVSAINQALAAIAKAEGRAERSEGGSP